MPWVSTYPYSLYKLRNQRQRQWTIMRKRGGRQPLAIPAEVAEFLRISEATLAQWRWRGIGPRWSKIGGQVRYLWEDIDAWVAGQENGRH